MNKTHCTRCGREINGERPRVCIGCMTDHEKLIGMYGHGYTAVLGERTATKRADTRA